jgi:hypothetical protein
VGYTRTVNGTLASEADDDWTLLEGQAAAANIDLVVKGLLPNGARGLVYQPGPNRYAPDRSGVTPLTRAELQAMAAGGAVLSLMGVPVGSGQRMGVDRDEDGLLDGDEPVPSLHIAQSSGQAVVSWPTNGSGYVLELSERLPAAEWRVAPGVRGVVDDQFAVTNQPAGDRRYFRLRSLEF